MIKSKKPYIAGILAVCAALIVILGTVYAVTNLIAGNQKDSSSDLRSEYLSTKSKDLSGSAVSDASDSGFSSKQQITDGVSTGVVSVPSISGAGSIDSASAANRLEVYFFDAGQADAILIKLPNGKTVMIDAGLN